jgi:hypothetical protein
MTVLECSRENIGGAAPPLARAPFSRPGTFPHDVRPEMNSQRRRITLRRFGTLRALSNEERELCILTVYAPMSAERRGGEPAA